MITAIVTGAPIIWWGLFILSFEKDRSRYRNCYLLFFALASTLFAIVFFTGTFVGAFLLITIALLIVPVFLIANGLLMFHREGHSMANLLSLALGLAIGLGEAATFIAVLGTFMAGRGGLIALLLRQISTVSALLSATVIYGSTAFLIFMIYSVFLQLIPRKKDFDYVIIHGAGLLQGHKVSKLLSDRIDKAIDVYHRDPTPPFLIPSGGKGDDEDLAEAEAMALYMKEKGIPAEHIILEDRSATTYENLAFSKAIIDAQEGRKYTALVTSNYHVYRALRYCRQVGLKCTGIGSHVALYYWPSALIREFIAVHAEKKHLVYFIIGWILWIAPVIWFELF